MTNTLRNCEITFIFTISNIFVTHMYLIWEKSSGFMTPHVFSFQRTEKEALSYNVGNIVTGGILPKLKGNSLQAYENIYISL